MRPITRPADQAANDPAPDRPENRGCCSDAAIEARTARQFETLAALTQIGMEVAGVVRREAAASAPPPVETAEQPEPDGRLSANLTMAYARIARAIRANLALENQITKEHRNRAARERAERDQRCAIGETARRNRLKKKVERVVKQAIDLEVAPVDRADFRSDMRDCLDEFDDDPDFTSRSVGEVAASVCGDLCLDPDWSWWEHEPWAVREIHSQPPGSPYVGYQPEPDDEPEPPKPETGGHDPPGAAS